MSLCVRRLPIVKVDPVAPASRLAESGYGKCLQCGRCTASCPAASAFGDFGPRAVMHRLELGDTGSLGDAIWQCGQCYTCHARCPRNNSAAAAILTLRQEAVARGTAPDRILEIVSSLRANLYSRGETVLPSSLTPAMLAEFGPVTAARCGGNGDRRARLGYDRDDAHARRIPAGSLAEIRFILDATGCGGEPRG